MKLSEELEYLLDNIHLIETRNYGGLCILSRRIFYDVKIFKYIDSNIPFNRRLYAFLNGGYWWRCNKIEPRKKWLEKHIKKLKAKGL